MKTKALGFGAVICVAVITACGSNTPHDWVGTYSSTDTFPLIDGGTQTISFEMQIATVGTNGISVGNLQDDGVIFNPFNLSLSTDGLSASLKCDTDGNGRPTGMQCNASLTNRKDLVMTGKDCSSGVTFSVSATKK